MAFGPGKYDSLCTEVREKAKAEGVLLIVVNGTFGEGFSCQVTDEILFALPGMLRYIADEIERSGAKA